MEPIRAARISQADYDSFAWVTAEAPPTNLEDDLRAQVWLNMCADCDSEPAPQLFSQMDVVRKDRFVQFGDRKTLEWPAPWRPWTWVVPILDFLVISCALTYGVGELLGRSVDNAVGRR
jgi:hypothetical protein